jgi:hypothetical protein
VVVNYGSSQTFTITANTGYHVSRVLVDGVSVGAVSSYMFSNVQATHTIAASFSQDPLSSLAYNVWVTGSTYYSQNMVTGTTTSNTNALTLLQSTANSVASAGGGIIQVLAGNYAGVGTRSYLYLGSNTILEGAGSTSTIFNSIAIRIGSSAFPNVTNVTVRDLGFTGAFEQSQYVGTIEVSSYGGYTVGNVTCERIRVVSVRGTVGNFYVLAGAGSVIDGVNFIDCYSDDSDNMGFLNWAEKPNDSATLRNFKYIRCEAHRCGLLSTRLNDWVTGFDFTESMIVENFLIQDCKADYCWASGFHWEVAPTKINNVIENCVASYNGQRPPPVPFTNAVEYYGSGYLVNSGITLINCTGTGNTGTIVGGVIQSLVANFGRAIIK